MRNRLALTTIGCASFIAQSAWAQGPNGLLNQSPASAGTTDVAQEGFQKAPLEEESKDTTTLFISAGGLHASGNSRSLALTSSGNFKLRRDIHQLSAATAINFGRSAADRDAPMETTVENYQGRVRYDVFFAERIAAFFQVSARRDRFQGLDLRLNIDPGLAYYFIDQEKQQFWAELGYDLQYDVRRDEALEQAEEEEDVVLEKTEVRHAGRAFVGYDNKLNKAVTFNTGVEYLQGLSPLEDQDTGRTNWRLNWDVALTSNIAEEFSIATTFTLKYDNNPLAGLSRTDTMTSVSLVYNLY